MRIGIEYEDLTYASDYIFKLKNTAFTINENLQDSLGRANDAERAVISLLSQICTETFPAMLESSRRLLQAIATDYKRLDDNFGNHQPGGQSAGSPVSAVLEAAKKAINDALHQN